jgi:hypothetical protein
MVRNGAFTKLFQFSKRSHFWCEWDVEGCTEIGERLLNFKV